MKKLAGLITSIALLSSCSITSQPIPAPMARMPSTVSMPTASMMATSTIRPSQTGITATRTMVSEKVIKNPLTNINLTLKHMCDGTLEELSTNGLDVVATPMCKGKNVLALSTGGLDKTLIESNSTVQGKTAVLVGAVAIGTGNQSRLLISFPRDYCSLTEHFCGPDGVGGPENYVTDSYDLTTSMLRSLKNYPAYGEPVWNKSNTKAVFLPKTCGGAGCIAAAIIGYDLLKDIKKDVTTEKAAERMVAEDVSGKALAYWQDLRWADDNNFVVTLVGVDGRKKEVKGTV